MAIKAVKSKGRTTLVDTKKKQLAGSIGKGKKSVPTAKKSTVKPVTKNPTAKKVSTTPVKTVAVKKVVAKPVVKKIIEVEEWIPEEVELDLDAELALIESELTANAFLDDIQPTTKGFKSNFRVKVKEQMETHSGVSWIADIYREGRKIGSAENRGDGGANYYYFDRREDRDDWETEATVAYENSDYEGDEDILFTYLDAISENPKLSEL